MLTNVMKAIKLATLSKYHKDHHVTLGGGGST